MSIHNAPLFDALGRSSIRLVPTRSEPGAVNMADAHARASGGIGVAVTSTGTGAGNAAGAMLEALTASSRVLHLTGQVETAHLDAGRGYIHEVPAQLAMLSAVSKVALRAHAGHVAETVGRALDALISLPQGPASVEIPIDLQHAPEQPPTPQLATPQRLAPDPSDLRSCAGLLASAGRPLIWAGGGVIASDAGESLRRLAERTGAGIITSNSGRGALAEDHPLCIGNFGQAAALDSLWSECDLLLSVGTRFRSNETRRYRLPIPPRHVQVDCVASAVGRSLPASSAVIGDARLVLDGLLGLLASADGAEPGWPERMAAAGAEARADLRSSLGPWEEIVDALVERLRPEDVFVRDVTISNSLWGNRLVPIRRPGSNIFAAGGGIGQGLPMALGAKSALLDGVESDDRRVIAMAGDGGLAVNLGELLTASQAGLAVTLLVFNDHGYGVLRNLQDARYEGRRTGVDLPAPDFAQLAGAVGWNVRQVRAAGEFGEALDWGLARQSAGSPAMVVLDMESIGPLARPFLPPE